MLEVHVGQDEKAMDSNVQAGQTRTFRACSSLLFLLARLSVLANFPNEAKSLLSLKVD